MLSDGTLAVARSMNRMICAHHEVGITLSPESCFVLQVCAGHTPGEQGMGPGCAGQPRVGAGRVEV